MTQIVQFGMNQFQRPNGFIFGKVHDLRSWREETRARIEQRREEVGGLTVGGQELTPQHQRQELIAKVESAKRSELVKIFNSAFPDRQIRIEQIVEAADVVRRGPKTRKPQPAGVKTTELELRERLKATILMAAAKQLKPIAVVANSQVRTLTNPGSVGVAKHTIDRVNYASRDELVAMHRVLVTATKTKDQLLDASGCFPKGTLEEQQLIEETMRANLRVMILTFRSKPVEMNKVCTVILEAADEASPRSDSSPHVT